MNLINCVRGCHCIFSNTQLCSKHNLHSNTGKKMRHIRALLAALLVFLATQLDLSRALGKFEDLISK